MFLQLRPAWNGEPRDSVTESQKYFRARFQRTAAASQDIGSGRFHTKILSMFFSLKYETRQKNFQILLSAYLKPENFSKMFPKCMDKVAKNFFFNLCFFHISF
jgi:hypothetical protein